MHPCECGGEYIKKHGPLEIQDPFVGTVRLDDIDYEECDRCAYLILPLQTAKVFDAHAEALLDETLKKQPIQDFYTAAETAAVLGITKQALHKNRKVRHGFIYHITLGGMAFYLKRSVALFKEKGDGRFLLRVSETHEKLSTNLQEKIKGREYKNIMGTMRYDEKSIPFAFSSSLYSPVFTGKRNVTNGRKDIYNA